jgi:hypothetical protein
MAYPCKTFEGWIRQEQVQDTTWKHFVDCRHMYVSI